MRLEPVGVDESSLPNGSLDTEEEDPAIAETDETELRAWGPDWPLLNEPVAPKVRCVFLFGPKA